MTFNRPFGIFRLSDSPVGWECAYLSLVGLEQGSKGSDLTN